MKTETQTIPVAIIGTGSIGLQHAAALNALAGAHGILIPKRAGRAKELSANGQMTASTLAEAKAQGCRLAVIASDTARHAEDAIESLRQGFDILVEKPAAPEAAGAQAI